MHVEQAERLPALHDEVADLFRVVSRFRWRLAFEQLLVWGLRGLIGSALVVIVLSVAAWLSAGPEARLVNEVAWVVALPLLAAVCAAVIRWPSKRQAALVADRRLVLDERLGTAIELAQRLSAKNAVRSGGRFDRLQLADAVQCATAAPTAWLVVDRHAKRDALVALLLVVMAAASLLGLPGLPRPSLPQADQTIPPAGAVAPDAPDRIVPPDASNLGAAQVQPPPQSLARPDADLASRVQQEQAESNALNGLSNALGKVSAGQPAADAMQQGDFSGAKQQLSSLGDEADQLSDAAKQQLSSALQQAASSNTADRQLADRERQAAQAMNHGTYADQRQAMHNLADQVERSGQHSAPSDQLARDQGLLQQQAAARQAAGQPAGQAPPEASGGQAADAAGAAADSGQPGGTDGGQGTGDIGQPGGTGAGTGSDPQPLGDQPSRLDSSGQTVSVPTKLSNGPGVRPPTGNEDQAAQNPTTGSQTVSEAVQSQQTGQVAPEQNLVPGEQRPVVRGYFR